MTSNHQPNLPLAAFFQAVFFPLQLRGRGAAYCDQFQLAIRWLAALLGREPTMADLNRETAINFFGRLHSMGLSPLTTRNIRRRLLSLWRYAHQIGYAAEPPRIDGRRKVPSYRRHVSGQACVKINGKRHYLGTWGSAASRERYLALVAKSGDPTALPLPPTPACPARAWNAAPAATGTLLHFYRTAFRPELVPQVRAGEVSRYDSAINHLHDYLGRPIMLAEVTAELLHAFRIWLDGLSLGTRQRIAYCTAIRRIMRASPFAERFPKRDGAEPTSTVGDAERERKALPHGLRGANRLPPLVGEPGTLLHFFKSIYATQAIAHCTDLHHRAIESAFRRLRLCFARDLALAELCRERIAEFQAWLREDGAMPRTIKNNVTRLLAVWRYANELNQAPAVPTFRRVRIPREQPDAWSLDELARILDAACQINRPPIGGIPAAKYWRAILMVCWYTALRRGSLVKIRTADVNLERGTLYVPGTQMKNGQGKMFHLGADALAAIAEIWDEQRELLFPPPADLKTLGDRFQAILSAAGVPKSRRPNGLFHKLRRTTITHTAARAGMAAAIALAGHSSQYVTERYLDPSFLPDHDATAWLPSIVDLAKRPGLGDNNMGGPTP